MMEQYFTHSKWIKRIAEGILFVTLGSLIMLIFNPWGHPYLSKVADYLGRIGLTTFIFTATYFIRRSQRFNQYWQILFALSILMLAVSLDRIFGVYLIDYLGITDDTPAGWAWPKLNECFLIVSVIILFTRISRHSLGSIYLHKGNLSLGLTIGMVTFMLAAAGSFPMANLFNANNLTLTRVFPWTPWLIIYVLSNALMEELLFRGLFLRKLEPFFGKFMANFMIALVFTLIHGLTNYSSDQYIFLAILFPLALIWGYIMQKTDSLWGSVLFHAGMDIPIMLGIFSNFS